MGLLAHYRRIWVAIVLGVLWLPIIGQLFTPAAQTSSAEARTLRKAPDFPGTLDEWITFPRSVDNFLADHFGFRAQTTHANALFRYALFSPTHPLVTIGRDHWLFYLGDEAFQQSLGLIIRPQIIHPFVDFIANLHRHLSEKNIKFLFTIVPNNSTISTAHLPFWAASPSRTEYDITTELIAARGVPTLDLRPALRAANALHPVYYRTDTHWNALGALVSRNEIMAAIGHPEWRIDIDRVFGGFSQANGKDLARFLGVNLDVTDQDPRIDLSAYTQSGGGPVILVIGDSFTQNYFPGIWVNGSKFVWMYHARCKFEMSEVEIHKPDIVIFAPVERYASCTG